GAANCRHQGSRLREPVAAITIHPEGGPPVRPGFGSPLILSLVTALAAIAFPTQGQEDQYTIRLRSRTFTPEKKADGGIQALHAGNQEPKHVILQFSRELRPEERHQLEDAGFRFHGWLGGQAYSATLPKGKPLIADAPLNLVRTTEDFKPEDKLARSLTR